MPFSLAPGLFCFAMNFSPKGVAQRRLACLAAEEGLANIYITTKEHKPGTMADGLPNTINKFMRKHPDTKLIVIETMQMAKGTSKDATYNSDHTDTGVFKDIADKHKVALLLIHHLRKQGDPNPSTESFTYGIYEFAFAVEQLSGKPNDAWGFVYTYNGESITTGYQIRFSLGIFTFHSIRADVIEKAAPNNTYSTTFPVAICRGGSGKTEITVTNADGTTATFKITCHVTQISKE